jgi:hypothetical protein
MYDDPIYARVINFNSYFLSFDLFSNECTAWCVGCPSVVAQYFYCATPSSAVTASRSSSVARVFSCLASVKRCDVVHK